MKKFYVWEAGGSSPRLPNEEADAQCHAAEQFARRVRRTQATSLLSIRVNVATARAPAPYLTYEVVVKVTLEFQARRSQ